MEEACGGLRWTAFGTNKCNLITASFPADCRVTRLLGSPGTLEVGDFERHGIGRGRVEFAHLALAARGGRFGGPDMVVSGLVRLGGVGFVGSWGGLWSGGFVILSSSAGCS